MLPCNFISCILGRAPRTKEDSTQFPLNHGSRKRRHNGVVLGYLTSTSILRVDGLSTGPPGFWMSQIQFTIVYIYICM